MKILLTGGAGYIGSHTAVELLARGYDVVIADNFCNSSPKVIERIEKISGKKVQLYGIDVSDREALEKVFAENELCGVIHFAGLKAVGESVNKPLEYYRCNISSALTVLDCMKKYGVGNIIFSSSATVYGNENKPPYTEDMRTGPCTNPYGWTKYMIEQIITDAAHADGNMSAILLRYFNPIGAHASGLIGEAPDGIPNNLMPYITQVAVGRREKLNIFGNDYPTPDGTGVRDYIHVCDLAKAHVSALVYSLSHKGAEIFNVGTGHGISVLELVNAFIRVNGVDVPYAYTARRDGDIAECYANAEKANSVLGWKAELDAEDMCRDSWNWQKNNPKGYDE